MREGRPGLWGIALLHGAIAGVLAVLMVAPPAGWPPLRALLDPTSGILSLHYPDRANSREEWRTPEGETVVVNHDESGIPHVRASSAASLFYAQGYLVARDRLWQMETLARKFSGRLAEVVGEDALEQDMNQRKLGARQSIETLAAGILSHPQSRSAVEAYVKGVNAWIDRINKGEEKRPLGFQLLDSWPEKWTVKNSAAIFRLMAWNLTFSESKAELQRTYAMQQLGDRYFTSLFPRISPLGTGVFGYWQFPLPLQLGQNRPGGLSGTLQMPRVSAPPPHQGSNVWAVGPDRSKTGAPILASDPHLHLTLPSIWHEVQLISDAINVYGVGIPGIPGVIIGFNNQVAWGFTNAGIDVLDYFAVAVEDKGNEPPRRYRLDDAWEPLVVRQEVIGVRGKAPRNLDVPWTIFGPLAKSVNITSDNALVTNQWLALRWLGHDESNELLGLLQMLESQSCIEFEGALASFTVPAQNIACIDRQGTVAMIMAGRIPLRGSHDGYTVGDGSHRSSLWQGMAPFSANPSLQGPEEGIVVAANQKLVNETGPSSIAGNYASFHRHSRISQILGSEEKWDMDSFKRMQLDDVNPMSHVVIPLIKNALEHKQLNSLDASALTVLQQWDQSYRPDVPGPVVFEGFWREWDLELQSRLWGSRDLDIPLHADLRLEILQGRVSLPHQGFSSHTLIPEVFHRAMATLANTWGNDPHKWRWRQASEVFIPHLSRLKGLGQRHLETGGSKDTINAVDGYHGPSWRMVVSLEDKGPKAFGIYPGSQSEHPSAHQAKNVRAWAKGESRSLRYMSRGEVR